jgi:hypothetical protein
LREHVTDDEQPRDPDGRRLSAANRRNLRIRPRADREIEAELIEARALGGGPVRADGGASRRRVPFSLSVRTTLTVPLGPDGKGMVYQAIFT